MLNSKIENEKLYLIPEGRIDTNNAPQFQKEADALINEHPGLIVVIDADDLSYISSAGLRVVLSLMKKGLKVSIINANSTVYEIFEATGFTEMMEVKKAYKKMSIEGLEPIGRGSNGIVYRVDEETIVKVYLNPDSLPDIQNERRLARYTFVHGIPTAISYDIVRVNNTYGSVFELLNSSTLSMLINEDPDNYKKYVHEFVSLLKTIHSKTSEPGDVPSIKETYLNYALFLKDYLPQDSYNKLIGMIEAVPEDNHLVHGDYYTNNVMMQGDDPILIDLDTLSCGNPVFEFASTFNAYVGFNYVYEKTDDFVRITKYMCALIWDEFLEQYFEGESEEQLKLRNKRAAILGFTRILRRHIKRIGTDTEKTMAEYNKCRNRLIELIDEVDSLI